jgi:hypothetical protein
MKTERIVDNPENHGWELVGGKWIWASGRNTGHITDGDTEGQIATWHDSANAWTPDSTVIVDGGNVGIGTDDPKGPLVVSDSGGDELLFSASLIPASTYTQSYDRNGAQYITAVSRASGYDFRVADSSSALTIDATGNATFSGTVNTLKTNSVFWVRQQNNLGLAIGDGEVFPVDGNGTNNPSALDLGTSGVRFKDGYFSGNLYKNGSNSPLINAQELIETLSTLRASTLDESVDVRQALASACDKLIEKFEAMQSEVSTQDS